MTKVKMLEPAHTTIRDYKEVNFYTHDQPRQYGDDRAREALEMAAKACVGLHKNGQTNILYTAKIIRALAKEIK